VNLETSVSERKSICQVWLSHLDWLWLLFPLHLPLSSFSLGANTVSSVSRKDISILRFPVWEQQFPPQVPPEVRCESLLVFYCTDERTRGKDRLVYVEWSSRKINMADLLLRAGQASHLLPACPYSHPQNWIWTCFLGPLITARQMEVLLLDSLSKFHVCCLA